MMEQLRQYLISIIAVSLICSVVQTFHLTGTAKELTKLICGLALSIAVIAPICRLDLTAALPTSFPIFSNAQEAISEGEKVAHEALAACIKKEAEAYILDIATEMGAAIDVEVTLSSEEIPVPVSAVICGALSAHTKVQLQEVLTTQLGIAKENLEWIG